MSALSYLCDYGSNSEESDSEPIAGGQRTDQRILTKVCSSVADVSKLLISAYIIVTYSRLILWMVTLVTVRPKLPVPNLSKVSVVSTEVHEDNPQLHSGRTRSFPHVRGNWATFVHVKYCATDAISELINKLQKIVLMKEESCQICDDFHISLSRTVVLKYHLISSFSAALHKALKDCESFDLAFGEVKILCNEENSRTFIALEVDPFTHKYLSTISKKVDEVLTDFLLPTFYEKPSFHMSILWVNGYKRAELSSILERLNELLIETTGKFGNTVLVDKISCKSGNKYFQYSLQ